MNATNLNSDLNKYSDEQNSGYQEEKSELNNPTHKIKNDQLINLAESPNLEDQRSASLNTYRYILEKLSKEDKIELAKKYYLLDDKNIQLDIKDLSGKILENISNDKLKEEIDSLYDKYRQNYKNVYVKQRKEENELGDEEISKIKKKNSYQLASDRSEIQNPFEINLDDPQPDNFCVQNVQNFKNSNLIYVDKSKYLAKIVSGHLHYNWKPYDSPEYFVNNRIYVLIGPRRFGKTLFLDLVKSFYEKPKEWWIKNNFEICKYPRAVACMELGYPVLYLNFSSSDIFIHTFTKLHILYEKIFNTEFYSNTQLLVIRHESYEQILEEIELLFDKITIKTKKPIVVLIDEYDKPILNLLTKEKIDENSVNEMVDKMSKLMSFFKSVSATKKMSLMILAGQNFNIANYFHDDPFLYKAIGITDKELRQYYKKDILMLGQRIFPENFIEKFQADDPNKKEEREKENIDKVIEKIRYHYDGFLLCEKGDEKLYNPLCINKLFHEARTSKLPTENRLFLQLYAAAGSSQMAKSYMYEKLKNPNELMNMLINPNYTLKLPSLPSFIDWKQFRDNEIIYAMQACWLTYDFPSDDKICIKIPNNETRKYLIDSLKSNYQANEVLDSLLDRNFKKFIDLIDKYSSQTYRELNNKQKSFAKHEICLNSYLAITLDRIFSLLLKDKLIDHYVVLCQAMVLKDEVLDLLVNFQHKSGFFQFIFELKNQRTPKSQAKKAINQIFEKKYIDKFEIKENSFYFICGISLFSENPSADTTMITDYKFLTYEEQIQETEVNFNNRANWIDVEKKVKLSLEK